MALTLPPAAPQRNDRATFSDRLDAFVTWLINFVTELLALVSGLNVLAAGSAYALSYTVDLSSTADADPTPGKLRLNSATQTAATTIYLDLLGAGGTDYTSILDQLDASTSAVKGQLRIVAQADPLKFLTFDLTARTTATGYRKLTVTNTGGSSTNPFGANEAVLIKFSRTGDKGDTGATAYPTLRVQDQKTAGSGGGSSVTGMNTRTLNTTRTNTITGASLSSNQVTLPAGKYKVTGSAPAYATGLHQAYLYDVGAAATLLLGTSEFSATSSPFSQSRSVITGEFTLAATTVIALRHFTSTANASVGLGANLDSAQANIFSELLFEKVT